MKASRWTLGLFLTALAMQSVATALEYCPQNYYGTFNGYYYYDCDYCMDGLCSSAIVATAAMHDTAGDVACCNAGVDTCVDPISGGSAAPMTASASVAGASSRLPVLFVDSRQRRFVGEKDRFYKPGPHVRILLDAAAVVDEANGGKSYFRLLKIALGDSKEQTICIGQEMDADCPPKQPLTGARSGEHFRHVIRVGDEMYDVVSVRDLPAQP